MKIAAELYGQVVLLKLTGELTDESLSDFADGVSHHLAGKDARDLVLDLEAVTFIDSAAFERLLDLRDKLVEDLGQVRLVHCGPNVKKILEMTRMNEEFEVLDDTDEAVKSLGA